MKGSQHGEANEREAAEARTQRGMWQARNGQNGLLASSQFPRQRRRLMGRIQERTIQAKAKQEAVAAKMISKVPCLTGQLAGILAVSHG